ncbi:MAG: hypothetical protein R3F13_10065 [Prosthecobacter sp.]
MNDATSPKPEGTLPDLCTLSAEQQEHAARAKTCMKRGIALLSSDRRENLPEALRCFDEALQLRQRLPVGESVWFRWLLTACWMNRGDVLTRLGSTQNLADAVSSFDEAIQHLERLPLDDDPQYRGRLVLAWMNRAVALRSQGNADALNDALISLDCAHEALLAGTRAPDLSLRASVMMNRAALLLELPSPRPLEAMNDAERLLEMCRPTETTEALAAELGLKARHVFCRAVAVLLETPPVDTTHADEWILRATDKVDEAMHLIAHWEKQGAPEVLLTLRNELFRFGCHMYLAWQPHFLAEFLLDVLDPDRGSPLHSAADDLHSAALEMLELAAAELSRRGPLDLGLQGMDRLLGVLESLKEAGERIQKLSK